MSAKNKNILFIEAGNSAWKAARHGKPNGQNLFEREGGLKSCGRGNNLNNLHDWLQQQPEQELVLATVGAEQEAIDLVIKLKATGYQVHRAQTTEIAGFEHCYAEPSLLGVDRWLTLVALRGRHLPVVVIDAGTAITLDVMDLGGEHLGGWIAPGFQLMQDALVSRSARLKVHEQAPVGTLGCKTEDAIALGCKAALQGFCEQTIVLAEELLGGQEFELYLSGGDVRHLDMARLPNPQLRPLLVLEGLYVWWQEQL